MQTLVKKNNGFTLVELLIAMTTGIIILVGIYAAFHTQQNIHTREQQTADAVQNVRGAAHFMVREIRSAGMDETGLAGAGFITAGRGSVRFTLDSWDGVDVDSGGDGDVLDANEDITYGFLAADDTNADGLADSDAAPLYRVTAGNDRLAEDIHAVGFAYAFDDDGDGELDYDDDDGDGVLDAGEEYWAYDSPAVAGAALDWDNDTGAALAVGPVNFDRIKAVRIWLLARTRQPLRGYSGRKIFTVGDKVIDVTDNFKYRLLTHTVKCRNMGI
jgi:type IV pilus assembly protein PilW